MTAYGSRNALADRPRKLTPAQSRTLGIAFTEGKVLEAKNEHGRVNPLTECLWSTAYELIDMGFLFHDGALGHGTYRLTRDGRERALQLPDKESSASRQHYIDTGRYLKYADREED